MEIEKQILIHLTHNQGSAYSKLWDKKIPSNKFAYYLNKLKEKELIEKQDEKYYLTTKGKHEVAYLSGTTGKRVKQPLSIVIIAPVENNKLLMSYRMKEPFYGYWGFIGGKIHFGETTLESAARELKEETGLTADFKLKGVISTKTYEKGKLTHHLHEHIIKAENTQGNLIEKQREGENKWINIEEFKKLRKFLDNDTILEMVLNDKFYLVEANQHQENGIIKTFEITTKQIL